MAVCLLINICKQPGSSSLSVRSGAFRKSLQVARQGFADPVAGMIGDAGKDILYAASGSGH